MAHADAPTQSTQQERQAGPFTLEYLGEHRQPTLKEAMTLPDGTETLLDDEAAPPDLMAGGMPSGVFGAVLVDESGSAWRVIDYDPNITEALVADYDTRLFGAESSNQTLIEGAPTPSQSNAPSSNWIVYDCGFSSKWVYTPGSQTDLALRGDQERGSVADGANIAGSFVVVGADLVLTAGHVNVNTNANSPDQSEICVGTSSAFQCRKAISSFENGSGCDGDWELIRVDQPFTIVPQPYDLAMGQDAYLKSQTPRHAGFPTIRMGQETTCGKSSFMQGERNVGAWKATKSQHLRLKITTGGNLSGGPYYFWHSTQGRYKLMGVHSGRRNPLLVGRFACGPKVPYWRTAIIAAGAALGGTF